MYISRNIDQELAHWKAEKEAKPLLIRGARQVGKSTSVRHLAEQFEHFWEKIKVYPLYAVSDFVRDE